MATRLRVICLLLPRVTLQGASDGGGLLHGMAAPIYFGHALRNNPRMTKKTPGQIVTNLAPPTEIGDALGVSRQTVWRWAQPKPKGTGGLIPSKYHVPLLRFAKKRKLAITERDLIHGRAS